MTDSTGISNHRPITLEHLLARGPLPLPEVVHFATMLAETLRPVHDSGRVSCGLDPAGITVFHETMELNGAAGAAPAITPYTAPEVLQGHTPDARSDIFAFGAIVYELAAGRRAFTGDTPDALALSLTISDPQPSGIPAIDHLVANCTAKDPAMRCQRIQKALLELKVLSFAAPRVEVVTCRQSMTEALRAETQQLESRVNGLIETHEKAIVNIQQSSGDAISELRERLAKVEAELAPLQARSNLVDSLCQRIMAHVEQVQKNIEGMDERVNSVREGVEVLTQGAGVLRDYVGTRMHEFEQTVKAQRTTIASVVASQSQTDDLVEGLVGAVDLLHTIVLDPVDKVNGASLNGASLNAPLNGAERELLRAM